MRWIGFPVGARDAWVGFFVDAARRENFCEAVIASFLCASSEWYVSKNDRMGPLLTLEQCKQVLQVAEALPETEEAPRSLQQLDVSLRLLRLWELCGDGANFGDGDLQASARRSRGRRRQPRPDEGLARADDCESASWVLPDLFDEQSSCDDIVGNPVLNRNLFAHLADDDSDNSGTDVAGGQTPTCICCCS